jgi:aminoglycoside phosphotransferase (APT) family kinase protein
MAADFNQPTVSGAYTDIPGQIRDMNSALATMHETDASSNKPTGAKQITSGGVIKRWNGSTWITIFAPNGFLGKTHLGGN